MIPVSTAIAVKAYLFNLLGTCLDTDTTNNPPDPPMVVYNAPGQNEVDDIVIVGAISSVKDLAAMVGGGGLGWQDEKAQIELTFTSYRGGDNMLAVEQRALHMLGLFDQALRADPSLGGNVIVGWLESYESDAGWADDNLGVAADVKAKVEFTARL
jgi:hypothetical protein